MNFFKKTFFTLSILFIILPPVESSAQDPLLKDLTVEKIFALFQENDILSANSRVLRNVRVRNCQVSNQGFWTFKIVTSNKDLLFIPLQQVSLDESGKQLKIKGLTYTNESYELKEFYLTQDAEKKTIAYQENGDKKFSIESLHLERIQDDTQRMIHLSPCQIQNHALSQINQIFNNLHTKNSKNLTGRAPSLTKQ